VSAAGSEPVDVGVSGLWAVLWPAQAEVVADVHDRTACSASVAQVVCERCGGALAEMLDPYDVDGGRLPVVVVVHQPVRPGNVLEIEGGPRIELRTGKLTPEERCPGKRSSAMAVPLYAVMMEGVENVSITVECGHHGRRGEITPAELFTAIGTGRKIRR